MPQPNSMSTRRRIQVPCIGAPEAVVSFIDRPAPVQDVAPLDSGGD